VKPPIQYTTARPASGEPSSCPGQGGGGTSQPRNPDMAALDGEIARLADRSTPQLRLAWRKLHHTGPPLGLSRDLMIRAAVNQLQERVDGGARLTLRRRLQTLAGEWKKDAPSFDPGVVLKSGTTLLRSGADAPTPSSCARRGSSTRASGIAR
jgi:Protein of unknown function (DUF2924)